MPVPYPDPVVTAILSALPSLTNLDGRVSTRLLDPFPAIRITKVGDHEAPTDWEAAPLYQIEVWADDEFHAGQIAWDIKNYWPTAVREVVSFPDQYEIPVPYAVVHGRWVDTNPNPSHDDEAGKYRFILTVGIRLSGAAS